MIKPTRPQPPPASVQKTANRPLAQQQRTPPAAPPAYRPQPTPKVLQTKSAKGQPSQADQSPRRPVAPPAYHPEAKKTVQPKMPGARQAPPSPKAPPVYCPQPVPKVLQPKSAQTPTTLPGRPKQSPAGQTKLPPSQPRGAGAVVRPPAAGRKQTIQRLVLPSGRVIPDERLYDNPFLYEEYKAAKEDKRSQDIETIFELQRRAGQATRDQLSTIMVMYTQEEQIAWERKALKEWAAPLEGYDFPKALRRSLATIWTTEDLSFVLKVGRATGVDKRAVRAALAAIASGVSEDTAEKIMEHYLTLNAAAVSVSMIKPLCDLLKAGAIVAGPAPAYREPSGRGGRATLATGVAYHFYYKGSEGRPYIKDISPEVHYHEDWQNPALKPYAKRLLSREASGAISLAGPSLQAIKAALKS